MSAADMTAETIPFAGPAAYWDAEDQGRFRALAGSSFLRVDADGNAVVLNADGRKTTVYPGWLVMLPEGGKPLFDAPNRVRVTG